jgi:MSHA biogenesis protein MshK
MDQTLNLSRPLPGSKPLGWCLALGLALALLTPGTTRAGEPASNDTALASAATPAPEVSAIPMKDPTRPNWYGIKARARQAASDLELSSIIISANRRLAVINGDLMREGEQRNGLLLKEVLKDRVLVVNADKQLRALRLPALKPVKG